MAYISSTGSTSSSINGYVIFDSAGSGKTARLYWRIFGGSWSLWNIYDGSSTTTHFFSIGGLSSNTRYQVSVDSYLNGSPTEFGPFIDIYTTSPPTPPPQVSESSITATPIAQRSPKRMTVSWNPVSGATGYRLYKSSDGRGSSYSYYPVTGSDGQVGNVTSYTVDVDYEWQNYWFQVTATNANGNAPNAYSLSGTKSYDSYPPIVNSWYASDIKTDRISVYLQATDQSPDSGSASGVKQADFYRNGSYVTTLTANGSGEVFYTYTGLAADTPYDLYCVVSDNAGRTVTSFTISPRTASNRPSDFFWNTSKISGNNFDITATEWNNLTSKIDAFRAYKGLGSFGFTSASSGATFEAYYYRQTASGISGMSPPTSAPPLRYTGDDILASDIDKLRTSLNSIP